VKRVQRLTYLKLVFFSNAYICIQKQTGQIYIYIYIYISKIISYAGHLNILKISSANYFEPLNNLLETSGQACKDYVSARLAKSKQSSKDGVSSEGLETTTQMVSQVWLGRWARCQTDG
jgi:hypothetical protein